MPYTRKEITPRIYKEVLGNNEKKIKVKLKKMTKNHEQILHYEKSQMANKHMKINSTLIIISKVKVKNMIILKIIYH